jgi:cell division protein FtsB
VTDFDDGGFKTRRDQGVWNFLNRLMIALIVIAVITLIVCAFIPLLKQQREQDARYDQMKADADKARALLARRTREIDLLQHDPAYVEIIARDRLDLMKDGETVFRIEQPPQHDTSNFKLRRQ